MMKDINRIIEKGISSMVPIYINESGNSTEITTKDGQSYIILKTLKTVLKIICRFYGADVKSVRIKYGKIINQKTIVPLPLSYNLVLIPFKTRKPIVLKDGSYGYINIFAIESIYGTRDNKGETIIQLKNGKAISCLCNIKTVKDHYNRGKVILNDPSFKGQFIGSSDNHQYNFYKEWNTPSTKGDIVRLSEEILAIRELLKDIYKDG